MNLALGLTSLFTLSSLLYLLAGALLGMFVGVIPGLAGSVVLSVLLVFVGHMSLIGTLCLMLGAHAGSYYSASITSILLNTPAHPEAFPVTFDGYPMARKGNPGRALGLSACSTCIGGIIGCAVFLGFMQFANSVPNIFHPPEYVALVILAMVLVSTLGADSVAKAVVSTGLGFMIAAIGPSAITGTYRYTFNSEDLYAGLSLVAVALGCFAVPQMVMIFGTGSAVARQDLSGNEIAATEAVTLSTGVGKQLIGGVLETFRYWRVLIQGGLTGALVGIIPGVGGFAANFLSYGIARQTSRKQERFGTGIPEGIIAPEGSSLSKEAGTMIPIVALGIPGSVGGAILIAALTLKGVTTGYGFANKYPVVPYQIAWIIALSGLIGTVAGVFSGPLLARITRVRGPLIVPFIFAVSVVGVYLAEVNFFSISEMLFFGVVCFVLRRLRYPLGSFILGLVLGPTFETNVHLTSLLYPGGSFITQRPLADVLLAASVLVLVVKARELHRAAAKKRRALAIEIEGLPEGPMRAAALRRQRTKLNPNPLLALIAVVFLLAVSGYFLVYGLENFSFTTGAMPEAGSLLVGVTTLVFLAPPAVRGYIQHLKDRKADIAARDDSRHPVAVGGRPTAHTTALPPVPAPGDKEPESEPLAAIGIMDREVELNEIPVRNSWRKNGEYLRELCAFAWLVGLIAACWLIGFTWAIALFMLAYGLTSTRVCLRSRKARVIYSVISAVIMSVATYEMFSVAHIVFTPALPL